MPEEKYYSYDELDENVKTNAVFTIDSLVRSKLSLSSGARVVNRPIIERIILELNPVFDRNGRAIYYTKKFTELTEKLIRDIYEQPS